MFSGGAYSDGPFSVPVKADLSSPSTESDATIAALVPAPTVSLHVQDGTAIGVASTSGMFSGGAFSAYDEYTVFGTGPTSQASIAGLVPGPTSQVRATCGNEDCDIDATVPAPTVQMAANNTVANKLAAIASVVPAPVASIQGEAKTGQVLGGSAAVSDLLNFARTHVSHRHHDDEEEPQEPEEQEPEEPLFTLPDLPQPPTAAEVAMQHAMAAHQLRMKQQAILHLLSQV